jgi:hypothetical protein
MSSADSQSVLNGVYSTLPIFNEVILPLDGITLSAAWEGDFAKLQFDVFENDKYDLFVVERSATGNAFEQVNNIVATAGINRQYDYKDTRQHSAEVFYRIKGITKQGMPVFSPVVKLKNTNIQQVRVYPNPVINFTITIEFLNRVNENVTILILGTKGEKLYYNQLNPGGNRSVSFKVPQMFDVQTLYILNITYSGNVINEKILFSR